MRLPVKSTGDPSFVMMSDGEIHAHRWCSPTSRRGAMEAMVVSERFYLCRSFTRNIGRHFLRVFYSNCLFYYIKEVRTI